MTLWDFIWEAAWAVFGQFWPAWVFVAFLLSIIVWQRGEMRRAPLYPPEPITAPLPVLSCSEMQSLEKLREHPDVADALGEVLTSEEEQK